MIITPFLVISFSVVFVLLFLFIKTIDKRKWLTLLVSIVLTPLVYFYIVYPLINIFSNYHHQKYFNAEQWVLNPGLRYEMIDYTITSDTLIGLQKNEIKRLLGEAEWLSWSDSLKAHNPDRWNYAMGIEPGALNTMKECIELSFKNDTLIKITPYQEEITFDAKN